MNCWRRVQPFGQRGEEKEETAETEEHPEEVEDGDSEADDNANQVDEGKKILFPFLFLIFLLIFAEFGKDEDGNLPVEELKRKIKRLSRQSA